MPGKNTVNFTSKHTTYTNVDATFMWITARIAKL